MSIRPTAQLFLCRFHLVFNARAQRSWRRRSWHRPRTPSPSSPSSWRHLRLDTIRARITKFGPEVELDERCSHTKFDVTGYFRSPASGHLINIFQFSRSNIFGTARPKCTKFYQLIVLDIFYISSKFYASISLSSSTITLQRSQVRRPISSNIRNVI